MPIAMWWFEDTQNQLVRTTGDAQNKSTRRKGRGGIRSRIRLDYRATHRRCRNVGGVPRCGILLVQDELSINGVSRAVPRLLRHDGLCSKSTEL